MELRAVSVFAYMGVLIYRVEKTIDLAPSCFHVMARSFHWLQNIFCWALMWRSISSLKVTWHVWPG